MPTTTSFTLTSDIFVTTAGKINPPSDVFVILSRPTLNFNSDIAVIAGAPPPTPPPTPPPEPPPPNPVMLPSPFVFPNSFCKNVSDCFPCNDLPTTNTSAEAQDVFQDFSIAWGNIQNNTPPIGSNFASNGCQQLCVSDVSQQDADLCAARQQQACVIHHWDPVPQDPPVCLSLTCDPFVPPVQPPPFQIFSSNPASCITHCPDGTAFTFTVPAGQFVAASQALADREAASFACREATLHRVCLTLAPTEYCEGAASSMVFSATGRFLSSDSNFWELRSGTLPPGFSFVSETAGTTLTILGTPTTAGASMFIIRVTAPNGDFMEKTFTVCVINITPDPLPDAAFGIAYSEMLVGTNCAEQPINWTLVGGSLPPGLFLDNVTGIISGTPSTPGLFHFTIEATTGAP